MYKIKLLMSFAFFSFNSLAIASDASEIKNKLSPIPAIEAGKVKLVKIKDLPAGIKSVAEADLGRNSLSKVGVYSDISDEAVLYMKNYASILKNQSLINNNLTFKLSNISKSEFSDYRFEGTYPEGPTKEGPWSSVTRVFKRNDGTLITLHEWDYIGDGGGVVVVADLMNTKVLDTPARLTIKKSPSGEILSELTWVTSKKYFTLTVWGEVENSENAKFSMQWLNKLASEIK